MGTVVYFIVGAWWQGRDELGCPRCIRKKLVQFAGINLPTANIAWPVGILPMTIGYWIASHRRGHSKGTFAYISDEGLSKQLSADALPTETPPNPLVARLLGALKLIIGLVAIAAVTLPLANEWYFLVKPLEFWIVLAICAGIVGIASALIWSGFANLRVKRATWKRWLSVNLVAAVVFAAASPLLVEVFWNFRERSFAEGAIRGDGMVDYQNSVPPQVWRADALEPIVDWRSQQELLPMSRPRWDLEEILDAIEKYHADDPQLQSLATRIREILDHDTPVDDTSPFGEASPTDDSTQNSSNPIPDTDPHIDKDPPGAFPSPAQPRLESSDPDDGGPT